MTVARPFNNYGPGMRVTDRRLPADFCGMRGGRPRHHNPVGRRAETFCYITDAINGYLRCLLHGEFDCFNIGIDKPEISVARLAQICQKAGREVFWARLS
jgi:UDP-glucuronate decarboxylase